jgi:hypothetical protein
VKNLQAQVENTAVILVQEIIGAIRMAEEEITGIIITGISILKKDINLFVCR